MCVFICFYFAFKHLHNYYNELCYWEHVNNKWKLLHRLGVYTWRAGYLVICLLFLRPPLHVDGGEVTDLCEPPSDVHPSEWTSEIHNTTICTKVRAPTGTTTEMKWLKKYNIDYIYTQLGCYNLIFPIYSHFLSIYDNTQRIMVFCMIFLYDCC